MREEFAKEENKRSKEKVSTERRGRSKDLGDKENSRNETHLVRGPERRPVWLETERAMGGVMAHPKKAGIYLRNKGKLLKGFKQGGEGEGEREFEREHKCVREREGG